MKPKVFVGSSVEGLSVGYAVQKNLRRTAEVTIWDQGIFQISNSSLESLLAALQTFDFALFVFSPDDLVKIRGTEERAVRDNVVFELGLFVGRLGKERCFIFVPENTQLHIPTDLIGLTPATYEVDRSDGNEQAGCGAACHDVAERIKRLSFFSAQVGRGEGSPDTSGPKEQSEAPQLETADIARPQPEHPQPQESWTSALISKNFDEARRIVSETLKTNTGNKEQLDGQIHLAVIEFERGNPQAASQFDELIARYPGEAEVYDWFASCYRWAGLDERALEVLEIGLNAASEKANLLLRKAKLLQNTGKRSQAIVHLKQATTDFPQEEELHAALAKAYIDEKQYSDAHNALVTGIENLPRSELLLSELASLAVERGDQTGAITIYAKLLHIDGKNARYRTLLGNAYLALDLFSLAMEAYSRGNELAENKAGWIVGNIGNLLNTKGLHAEAIKKLEEALKLEPESVYCHDRLARAMENETAENERLKELLKEARPVFSRIADPTPPISTLALSSIAEAILKNTES